MALEHVPDDPLQSPVWEAMVERYLAGAPIVFDDKVKIGLPPVTEDQTQVPITIDARELGQVDEMAVIGDLNPFPLTVKVTPHGAPAFVGFRMRIEQGTVIRAAVKKDGKWRVGERYLDASGGGCSAPSSTEAKVDWDQIGHMQGKVWRENAGLLRLRLRIVHPMDTGLQKNPMFCIQTLAVRDHKGAPLVDVEVHEAVAMNPTFTILTAAPNEGDHLVLAAADNDGGDFKAIVPIPPATAADHVFREGRL